MNCYTRGRRQLLEKVSWKIRQKAENIFCTPVTKLQKISSLNICNKAKQIYPKKQKKASEKKNSMSFRSSHPKVLCKKGVLTNFATCLFGHYWNRHQVVDKNLSKSWYQKKQPFLQYLEVGWVPCAGMVSTNN